MPTEMPLDRDVSRLLDSPALSFKLNELRLARRFAGVPRDRLVSVLMPTWNRRSRIVRAVRSVHMQTYANYELIIIDDGSTDGTEAVVRAACADDPRMRYIRIEHQGVSRARNVGLGAAKGELIAYLDSDNEWSQDYLLIMANALRERPEASSAYCGVRVVNVAEARAVLCLRPYERASLLQRNYVDINAFVHLRSLVEQRGGFRTDVDGLEDWELVLRYTEGRAPVHVECVLVTYYVDRSADQVSATRDLRPVYQLVKSLYPQK
jgi:glycosyltransferase involved in cell wall biosynthesis